MLAHGTAPERTLMHLSDLHVGRSADTDRRVQALADALCTLAPDRVVVTGDITDGGDPRAWDRFRRWFAPLAEQGRLAVVPGNHDRLGADLGRAIGGPDRVRVLDDGHLVVIACDSTGTHNRYAITGHGLVSASDLRDIDDALARVPPGRLVAIALHHHPVPLPTENTLEHISSLLRLPYAAELSTGRELVELAAGRCDLVLHGHRHVPRACTVGPAERPLRLLNAGSTSELGRARLLSHHAAATLVSARWIATPRVDEGRIETALRPAC